MLVLALGMMNPGTARALEIEQVQWGFDGEVTHHQFTQLSILVSNPSDVAVDGRLLLRKSLAGGQPVDAPLAETVFIAPYTSRWVQFYPFVTDDWQEWSLTTEDRRFRAPLPKPRTGGSAHVVLDQSGELRSTVGPIRRFPEELFPAFVTGTGNLATVVLDHVPRWEASRRSAFLDWIRLGGRVILLPALDGSWPTFSDNLAVLNSPLSVLRLDSGAVVRYTGSPQAITSQVLTNLQGNQFADFAAGKLSSASLPNPAGKDSETIADEESDTDEYGASFDEFEADFVAGSSPFFQELKGITIPEHNWPLLNLLALSYLFIVFPGCYTLGRWRKDFRLPVVALLGTVTLFSLAFLYIGRRGYGESTTINTVGIVRSLGREHVLVEEWSNMFVTSGGDYTIAHKGEGVLYSACEEVESVKGVIENGRGAQFVADIPPFSSRTFAVRTKLPVSTPELAVTDLKVVADDRLSRLNIKATGEWPFEVQDPHLLYGEHCYRMNWKDSHFQLVQPTTRRSVLAFIKQGPQAYQRSAAYGNWDYATPEQRYRRLFPRLLQSTLNLTEPQEISTFHMPDHQIRLFFYSKPTDAFSVQSPVGIGQQGRLLFYVDLDLPIQTPASQR